MMLTCTPRRSARGSAASTNSVVSQPNKVLRHRHSVQFVQTNLTLCRSTLLKRIFYCIRFRRFQKKNLSLFQKKSLKFPKIHKKNTNGKIKISFFISWLSHIQKFLVIWIFSDNFVRNVRNFSYSSDVARGGCGVVRSCCVRSSCLF